MFLGLKVFCEHPFFLLFMDRTGFLREKIRKCISLPKMVESKSNGIKRKYSSRAFQ
jgi:hypothetical protein